MRTLALLVLLPSLLFAAFAQDANQTVAQQVVVPRLVRFSGQIKDASGTVGITFTLHKAQSDSNALWVETQNVTLDATGKYTVLLGATKSEGLPVELFTSGEAQWLGIHVQGQADQPRVLLVSVPYALKAAEAETLGGHSANDFVTSDKVTTLVKQQLQSNNAVPSRPSENQTTTTAAVNAGPTKFKGTTTDNIVAATQTGTGTAVTAIAPGTAVYGTSTNTSGNAYGVKGASASASGFGVYGLNTASTGSAVGIYGQSSSNSGVALSGLATASTGSTKGIVAAVNSPSGTALVVQNSASGKLFSGQAGSGHTEVFSVDGGGIVAAGGIKASSAAIGTNVISGTATGESSNGVYGSTTQFSGYGVYGLNTNGVGVYGVSNSDGSAGVLGLQTGTEGGGVDGSGPFGVRGYGSGSSEGVGVYGEGTKIGVSALGPTAVSANSNLEGGTAFSGTVEGNGVTGDGVVFSGSVTNVGGYAIDTFAATGGYAAWFNGNEQIYGGNLAVTGTVTSGAGAYQQIDHPLEPTSKYLNHASVGSSEMMNMYSGNVTTDASGEALVQLPAWFEEVNGDFRYQLTPIGQFAQAIVGRRIENHTFTIRTDKPNVDVSWLVTGVRKDAYAKAHPMQAEQEKPQIEKGSYLQPEAFGQPEEKSAGWARRPAAMKHWKEIRTGGTAKAQAENSIALSPATKK